MGSKKKLSIVAILLVLVIVAILVFMLIANNEKTVFLQDSPQVAAEETALKRFEGVGFAVQIPDSIRLKSSNEAVGQALLQYMFADTDAISSDQLGISIGSTRPTDLLTETALVKMRISRPEIYRQVVLSWLPQGAIVFEKNDSFEISVFFGSPSGDRYSAVVVSGTADRRVLLTNTLRAAVTSWEWL